jgi:hypothetical protein
MKRIVLWVVIPVSIPIVLAQIGGAWDTWSISISVKSLVKGMLVGLWYGALLMKRHRQRDSRGG